MTAPTRSTGDSDVVQVAYVHDQAEAEFLQGLLHDADVGSVVRRAPGFDLPEFLAGGPRHVRAAASDVPMLRRCHSTVRALMNSWVPISGLVRPLLASRAICVS